MTTLVKSEKDRWRYGTFQGVILRWMMPRPLGIAVLSLRGSLPASMKLVTLKDVYKLNSEVLWIRIRTRQHHFPDPNSLLTKKIPTCF